MIAVCVLLGFAVRALLFGPLFLMWWLPERLDRHDCRHEAGSIRGVRG